jgi:hypothetical protein
VVAEPAFEVRVDPAVYAARPDYVALVLVASGLANGPTDAGSDAQLAAAEAQLRASVLKRATDHAHDTRVLRLRSIGRTHPRRAACRRRPALDLLHDRWPNCRLDRLEHRST